MSKSDREMRRVQGPFTDMHRFRNTRKPSNSKGFLVSGTIIRNICNNIWLQGHLPRTRDLPRFIPYERPSFQRLPVLRNDDLSLLDAALLAKIYERTVTMIHMAGTNAEMARCDFEAGTKAEDIQALAERLQRRARGKGSRVHYVIQAELAPGDTENHWHAVLLYDASVMDFPAQVNGAWEKIRTGRKIIWRRNRDLPFRFRIGASQAELERAFYAASYLCKSSTPPLTTPKHKARIISRMPFLPGHNPEFQEETKQTPPAMTARSFRTQNLKKAPEFQGKEQIHA